MTRQQKDKALDADHSAPAAPLSGNKAAAAAVQHAKDALAVRPSPSREEQHEYLLRSTVVHEPQSPHVLVVACADLMNVWTSVHQFDRLVEAGLIDPNTMTWTELANAVHPLGMICCCLVPGCSIGPFVPIRI